MSEENPLPDGWRAVTAEDGARYYWNTNNDVTSWVRPQSKSIERIASMEEWPTWERRWAECLDKLEAPEDESRASCSCVQATGSPELQTLTAQPARRPRRPQPPGWGITEAERQSEDRENQREDLESARHKVEREQQKQAPRRPQPPGWETMEAERQNEDQQRRRQREIEKQQREADRQTRELERQRQAQQKALHLQAQQAEHERVQQQRQEEWILRKKRLEQQREEQLRHQQQHWQKQREWRGGDRPLHERNDSLEWDSECQSFTESQRSARSSTAAPKAAPSPKVALKPKAPRALGRFFDTFRY